jgi:acetoacetyl-CoA synthetase
MSEPDNPILWTPSPERASATAMARFGASLGFDSYEDLWRWSIDDLEGFWAAVWDHLGVIASSPYDRVMGEPRMPGTEWFPGARLNFAENLLRRRGDDVALIGAGEGREDEHVTFDDLRARVARAQAGLRRLGVVEGDRVAAVMPNCVETVVLMLATTALGGVWSSSSPDFGPMGIIDRFGQIRPRVLCTVDGYRYHGRAHPTADTIGRVLDTVEVEHVVLVDFAGLGTELDHPSVVAYDDLLAHDAIEPDFVQVPFDHPLYVMYSSGTTGVPKSIVHGAGGTLLTHLKEHRLHTDIHPGDTVFWFTTCGWMMWNWLVSALASEATVVLYDGSPSHPDLTTLWELAERTGVTHFGTSPKFLAANANAGVRPAGVADLSSVRTLASTGAPLNPDQFDWVYDNVGEDLQLASVSGGTDIIACFVGSVPTEPVRRGEIQARSLGMAVEAWDDDGNAVIGEKGELVCTRPFPSLPVAFWGDEDGSRYREAYFAEHPGVWTHGDFIEIREHGGVVIYGRSDTTLNPGGVRIGTAEIYRAIEGFPELDDAIVVGRRAEGDVEVVLCCTLAGGAELDDDLIARIKTRIRGETTPRHVPRHVFAVPDIPYTISGKKVEKAVRQMIEGEEVRNRDALANPEALDHFADLPF